MKRRQCTKYWVLTLFRNYWYLALASLEFSQMIHNPQIKVKSTSFIPPIFIKSQSQTKMALFTQFWPFTTLLLLLGWQTKTNSNRAHHSQCSLCQTYGEESSWPIVGKTGKRELPKVKMSLLIFNRAEFWKLKSFLAYFDWQKPSISP